MGGQDKGKEFTLVATRIHQLVIAVLTSTQDHGFKKAIKEYDTNQISHAIKTSDVEAVFFSSRFRNSTAEKAGG